MSTFTIVDLSTLTLSEYGGPLTRPVLDEIAGALEEQANVHIAPEWGGSYVVRVAGAESEIQPGEIPVLIRDDLPDAPGAAAYHDKYKGVPIIYAARNAFSEFLSGQEPLSEGLSHEIAETIGDPSAALWADRGDGTEEAIELCDRVQQSRYQIGNVTAANFLHRAAFFPEARGPYDYLSVLIDQQGKTANGYVILRTSGADLPNGEIHGAMKYARHSVWAEGSISGTARVRKAHFNSRSFRRGLRL